MNPHHWPAEDPAKMRRTYLGGQLTETTVAAAWPAQFEPWFHDAVASGAIEPNAMQLATVDGTGRPSVRTVLMKAYDERGVVFYTNRDSAKGRDLAVNPYAAAVFVWLALERQVRFSGPVEPVTETESAAYFATRPRGSQIAAWASAQSSVISSRQVLEQRVGELEHQFAETDVPLPPDWGGYRLLPEVVEFWQGRVDRLHDRIRYRHDTSGWLIERLAP